MVAKYTLAFYCLIFIKCCGPQIQNIPFSTQNIFKEMLSHLAHKASLPTEQICSRHASLCYMRLWSSFWKNIWRSTCKTSMMNLKNSLVNKIVVTLVALIWLFIIVNLLYDSSASSWQLVCSYIIIGCNL